jgi:hypothetical protein
MTAESTPRNGEEDIEGRDLQVVEEKEKGIL